MVYKFLMTTTFYPPYHIGGDAMHVYHLSNELARLGHEVHIVHNIDSYRWQRKGEPLHKYPNHENITIHSIKSPIGKLSPIISYVFGSSYPETRYIKNLIKDIKPDIIHHHNIAGFGPFILDFRASKVLYTAHDYWLVCPLSELTFYNGDLCKGEQNCFTCSILSQRPPQLWRYRSLLSRKLKNIDKIIAPSEYMKNKLQELGINGSFAIMPNFVPDPPKIEKALYGFPYFLYVGVLEKHKGILDLVDEYICIKDEIKNVKLLIVGSGSLENTIKNTVINNRCEDKIIMLGRIDELTLANVYANAIAVIIPSKWPENCPLVALEALANSTPIIVSDKGGLPELINISNAGIVINKDFSIRNFLKDIPRMRILSEYIKVNHNNKYFSGQYYIKKYLDLIN